MRLVDRVHLVGSGAGGFGLTDAHDAHVYVIDGDRDAALVDAGCGRSVDRILAGVEAAGIATERLSHLLITHAHPDHCGGAAALRALLPGLRVAASPDVAQWISTADEEAMSVEAGKRAEFYPQDFSAQPCPVETVLRDGDRIDLGAVEVIALATPGHADGHLSYLSSVGELTVLLGGDLVFFGGRVSLLHTWDCRVPAYGHSMAKLRDAGIDALLPGHHSLSLRDGQRHIDTANRLFDAGFVPPSVV